MSRLLLKLKSTNLSKWRQNWETVENFVIFFTTPCEFSLTTYKAVYIWFSTRRQSLLHLSQRLTGLTLFIYLCVHGFVYPYVYTCDLYACVMCMWVWAWVCKNVFLTVITSFILLMFTFCLLQMLVNSAINLMSIKQISLV